MAWPFHRVTATWVPRSAPRRGRSIEALQQASADLAEGETSADRLRLLMAAELTTAPLGVPDYVSIADAETLEELDIVDRPALASLAVRFPSARLIDCLPIDPPADPSASGTPS